MTKKISFQDRIEGIASGLIDKYGERFLKLVGPRPGELIPKGDPFPSLSTRTLGVALSINVAQSVIATRHALKEGTSKNGRVASAFYGGMALTSAEKILKAITERIEYNNDPLAKALAGVQVQANGLDRLFGPDTGGQAPPFSPPSGPRAIPGR